jgi:microcystin-dependent protein
MDGYLGAVRLFAGINPPRGWLPCDGRTVAVSQNDINSLRLLQVLGTNYGGNGTTSVGLPRLATHPQAIQAFGTMVPQYLICTQGQLARPVNQNGGIEAASEDYVGEVVRFAGNYLPQGLLPAQGITLPINFNQALFSVLGPRFTATPNSTTFQVPLLASLPAENGPPVALLVASAGYYPSRG